MVAQAKLGSVFVVVADMPRSLTFYEHLGFEFSAQAFAEQYVEAELPGGMMIFWVDEPLLNFLAPDYLPMTAGRLGLSFELDSPHEVDALFEKLKGLGYRGDRIPWDAPWGFRYAIVYDPDGNMVQLYSHHAEDSGVVGS
jgi:catechol 2,3-dioxygenase-like lactoylglutathione lyase family enzyme